MKQDLEKMWQEVKEKWNSEDNAKRYMHAISFSIENGLPKALKEMEKALTYWFGKKLFSLGRTIKELEVIADRSYGKNFKKDLKMDYGLGFSIKTEKGKMNIGRWIGHLMMMIEQQKGETEWYRKKARTLEEEYRARKIEINKEWQTLYLEEEAFIINLYNNKRTSKSIKKQIERKFGRLLTFTCGDCKFFDTCEIHDDDGDSYEPNATDEKGVHKLKQKEE